MIMTGGSFKIVSNLAVLTTLSAAAASLPELEPSWTRAVALSAAAASLPELELSWWTITNAMAVVPCEAEAGLPLVDGDAARAGYL